MKAYNFKKGQRVKINTTEREDLSNFVKDSDGNVYGIIEKNKNKGPWSMGILDPVSVVVVRNWSRYGASCNPKAVFSFERTSLELA